MYTAEGKKYKYPLIRLIYNSLRRYYYGNLQNFFGNNQ